MGQPSDNKPEAPDNTAQLEQLSPAPTLSAWKKALFAAVALSVFFVLIELLLALCGLRPILYDQDPYVGFASNIPLFTEQTQSDGSVVMVTARNKLVHFNMQRFAKKKPAGTYRIFCMGGSTTQGRPYDDTTSFCGWLRAMLQKADSTRQWDLINAGGSSYASYRVARIMEELTQYEPDMFIIYSGHNEFLEQRTFSRISETPEALREFATVVCRTRIGTLGKRILDAINKWSRPTHGKPVLMSSEVETILEKSIGPEAYHRDEQLQKQVLQSYRYNLTRMTDIARSVGAKVIFVTPASNLRNCSPFKSEHRDDLNDTERQRWEDLFARAKSDYENRQWNVSLESLDEAATIDDRYAELHYLRGRLLWELERYDEAKTAFIRAKDEDICSLRAFTPVRGIVIEVAAEKRIPVVDFATMLEQIAEHGIPGDDLFLDMGHPTIEGHRQLALKLLETMTEEKIVHPADTWNDSAIEAVKHDVESRLDRKAHGIALRNLATLFKWAGKYEEAHQLALRAAEMVPKDSGAHYQLGASAAKVGQMAEAEKHYRLALQLDSDHPGANTNLANILVNQGNFDEAITLYRRALRSAPELGRVHQNLGAALAAQGNFDEAISYYRQALKLEPDSIITYYNMGNALTAQGKFDQAIPYYRQALQLEPDYANAHKGLATALTMTKQFEQALEHCREMLRLRPDHPQTLARMAWILATNPDPKFRDANEAIRLVERAAELTKHQDPVILSTLATVYAAAGKFEQAVATAQTALPLAHTGKKGKLANHIKKQLDQYKQGKTAP